MERILKYNNISPTYENDILSKDYNQKLKHHTKQINLTEFQQEKDTIINDLEKELSFFSDKYNEAMNISNKIKEENYRMRKRLNDLETLCAKLAQNDTKNQKDLRMSTNHMLEMKGTIQTLQIENKKIVPLQKFLNDVNFYHSKF